MSLIWLQPWAWWGLGLLIVPVLLHLLTRHRSRRVLFPSLKFLPTAQMAALRRREITNWPLLVVRLVIVASAVAAAASPVVTSAARRAAWDARVARAFVIASADEAADETALPAAGVQAEAASSFVSNQFRAPRVADALRDAAEWLRRQPPAAREIVVVGDLRHGAMSESEVNAVPPHVGIRFVPDAAAAPDLEVEWTAVGDRGNGASRLQTMHLSADANRTRVRYTAGATAAPPSIRVLAAPAQQAHADAVLRAVWREGVVLGVHADRSIEIAFAGAPRTAAAEGMPLATPWMREAVARVPEALGADANGTLSVQLDVAATDPRAARIVFDVLRGAFADARRAAEPRRVAASTLASWSRPPGGSPPDAVPADEGDRRWLWAAAVLLMAVEQVLRRRPRDA